MRIDIKTLDAYREAEGITTRAELARRMGVSGSSITRIYNGEQRGEAVVDGLFRAFPDRPLPILPD